MSDYDYSHEKGRDIGDVKGMEQPLKTGKTGRGTANPAPKIVSRLREMRTVTDSFKWHNHAVFSEVYKLERQVKSPRNLISEGLASFLYIGGQTVV